ncbi:TPA: hypothetical protein DEP96_01030 [Candidatus Uhrbacteria bacterium]|nr:hypothetical protein [Candidatus Uhrbacteria bacterium]
MEFERHLEDDIFALHEELTSGVYHHSPYEQFTVHDPKQRTIHKAVVRDRVVHQAIINIIEPIFEPLFIFDSFSSRSEKGVHAAVNRLRIFLRRASVNDTRPVYAAKCDIRKFFDSIDHVILLKLLSKHIVDHRTLQLLNHVIASFTVTPGVGLPLGNLTSQLLANIYLHELDFFVKHQLKVKYHIRYCDDFVMLSNNYDEAMDLALRVDEFLCQELKLQLHPNKVYVRTWRQGVDFLGSILLPYATILRPSTAKRLVQRATSANVSSYLGLCVHADAYGLEKLVMNRLG